jgi:hypothetical protein
MPRADLQKAEAKTEYWYFIPQFKTKEECEAAIDLLKGLIDTPLRCYEKKVIQHGLTIAGRTIMEVFKVPNRSYHLEDIQAFLEERHFAAGTSKSYLPALCRAGLLRKLGPQTYVKPYDPVAALCPDIDLDATSDGHASGLEQGQAHLDRCGNTR